MKNKANLLLGGAAVLGLTFGLGVIVTQAMTPATDVVACVKNVSGEVRIVEDAVDCKSNEMPLTWSIVGPQGPQGATGATGADGADGADGDNKWDASARFTTTNPGDPDSNAITLAPGESATILEFTVWPVSLVNIVYPGTTRPDPDFGPVSDCVVEYAVNPAWPETQVDFYEGVTHELLDEPGDFVMFIGQWRAPVLQVNCTNNGGTNAIYFARAEMLNYNFLG